MTLFDFSKLPIYEIGLSVEFEPIHFSSAYIGLYWQTIKDQFSETEDLQGIFSEEDALLEAPIKRINFINPQKSTYIQLGNNGFAYIYRKTANEHQLTLSELIQDFCLYWQGFRNWLLEVNENEDIVININCYRFVVKYLLDHNSGWTDAKDHNQLFKNKIDVTNLDFESILSYQFDLIYLLPNSLGACRISTETGISIEDQSKALFLNCTNTIQEVEPNQFDVQNWFNQIYEHHLKSLSALTTENLQEQWR